MEKSYYPKGKSFDNIGKDSVKFVQEWISILMNMLFYILGDKSNYCNLFIENLQFF